MDLATPDAFHNDPSLVWQFYSYRRHAALKAKPNKGHYALAELARRRPDTFLTLTQNVDGLSARANHPQESLLCLHGDLFTVKCTSFMCSYKQENVFDDPLTPELKVDDNELAEDSHYSNIINSTQGSTSNFSQTLLNRNNSSNNNNTTNLIDNDSSYYSSGVTDVDDSAYSSSSSFYIPNGYNLPARKKKSSVIQASSSSSNSTTNNDTPDNNSLKNDKHDNNENNNSINSNVSAASSSSTTTTTTTTTTHSKKPRKKKYITKTIPVDLLPRCPSCKVGLLRPGVVWFGETLPFKVLQQADDFITDPNQPPVDLILVIGTSGTVWPAAGYVEQVTLRGGKVAIFNIEDSNNNNNNNNKNNNDFSSNSNSSIIDSQLLENGGGWMFKGDAAELLPLALEPIIGTLRPPRRY